MNHSQWNFLKLGTKQSYKLTNKPLNILIEIQKFIESHLHHKEIPQL